MYQAKTYYNINYQHNTIMDTLYNIALVTHVIGITIMAGATFVDYITFRALGNAFRANETKALVLGAYLHKLQRFMGIGLLIILISGVAMMAKLHEVWDAQLWFRIKMGVLLLIIINGLGLRRRIGAQLNKLLVRDLSLSSVEGKWQGIKRNFTIVVSVQMLLFILIYVLSIFKFV